LSARHPGRVPLYAAMATLGSVIGTSITVWLSRKGAETVLKRTPGKTLRRIEKGVRDHAGWAVGLASVMPPPFPFTFFIAVAAALEYPVKKLLSVVAGGRAARFVIEGLLAVKYGHWILSIAESPRFRYVILLVGVLAIGGTAYSIYEWVARSRRAPRTQPQGA
jgi:membrane protein YqaA with SNARE-associated domain